MNEQIKKMAKDICLATQNTNYSCKSMCKEQGSCAYCIVMAESLYNANCRKQEWISVEDKLPTWEDGKVLIYTTHGISIAQRTTSVRWQGDLAKPKWITHWMPRPEPPKAKGGAE